MTLHLLFSDLGFTLLQLVDLPVYEIASGTTSSPRSSGCCLESKRCHSNQPWRSWAGQFRNTSRSNSATSTRCGCGDRVTLHSVALLLIL
jgi:hypothetical protein